MGEPDLPKDPAEYRPKPLMGWRFWVMMAFGFICVLAGAGVAMLLPRLLPVKPDAPAAAPVTPSAPVPAEPPRSPAAAISAPDTVAALNARIAALETQGEQTSHAAVAALAAAELVEASQGSRPFGRELAALRAAAPDLAELAALSDLAEQGAPSRAALAAAYPTYAARAASRAHEPGAGAGLGERLAYTATRVVSVRRVDDITGASPDARLARAEAALNRGDVQGALQSLDGLPAAAQHALAPWRAGAERRAEIDREVAALRRQAGEALRRQATEARRERDPAT
jgi:hypothetical protein